MEFGRIFHRNITIRAYNFNLEVDTLKNEKLRINLGTFDLIKGLALLMIVCGHKLHYYTFDSSAVLGPIGWVLAIFQYGINPLFYIIAGVGIKSKPVNRFLRTTFSELIRPYLFVTLSYAICFPILHYVMFRWWPGAIYETKRYVLAFLLGIPESGKEFLGYELYECSIMWFFLSLFIGLNFVNLVLKIKNEVIQGVIVFAGFFIGYVLGNIDFNYFCIPQGLLGMGYCYIGYIIKKYTLYNHKNIKWICLILTLISIWQGFFGDFAMGYGIFKYGFLECVMAACSGTLAMFIGIKYSTLEWKCLEPIRKIGMYAYWIMCIHAVDMSCIPWYRWSELMKDKQALAYAVELIATIAIMTIGCSILKRISKYRYLRKKKNVI